MNVWVCLGIKRNTHLGSLLFWWLSALFFPLQISNVWKLWAWNRGRFIPTKSQLPPSIAPTGLQSALAWTTPRTGGLLARIPTGSGYRYVAGDSAHTPLKICSPPEGLLKQCSAIPNAFKSEERNNGYRGNHSAAAACHHSLRKTGPADVPENAFIFSDTSIQLFREFEHRCLTLVTTKRSDFSPRLHIFYSYTSSFNRFLFPWWNTLALADLQETVVSEYKASYLFVCSEWKTGRKGLRFTCPAGIHSPRQGKQSDWGLLSLWITCTLI